jgi:hypothetical protein
VSVVGPAGQASQRELQRIALAKLMQRLTREGHAVARPETTPKDGGSGGGIIV